MWQATFGVCDRTERGVSSSISPTGFNTPNKKAPMGLLGAAGVDFVHLW
jgi:hypothetical protein